MSLYSGPHRIARGEFEPHGFGVHLDTAITSAAGPALSQQLSQPQQHREVSGSKLIRRPHGFWPLRLGQPRSGGSAMMRRRCWDQTIMH